MRGESDTLNYYPEYVTFLKQVSCKFYDSNNLFNISVHPLISVTNQLLASPIARDVVMQCEVQASPKAMNHWSRINGKHFSLESSLTDTNSYILRYPDQSDTHISNYWPHVLLSFLKQKLFIFNTRASKYKKSFHDNYLNQG